ncbi:hypothetical protein FJTKL_13391 [Diaporthe vaccinii]|uniref:Uncharacterized protein n=1 Tax=Diaporthe vaccinii TaxID=105482 RepID=A0ABR4EAN9_9PEZI
MRRGGVYCVMIIEPEFRSSPTRPNPPATNLLRSSHNVPKHLKYTCPNRFRTTLSSTSRTGLSVHDNIVVTTTTTTHPTPTPVVDDQYPPTLFILTDCRHKCSRFDKARRPVTKDYLIGWRVGPG